MAQVELVEAANVAARHSKRLPKFHQKVARRRGSKTANIALAREILSICYYLLKKGESYRE